MRTLLFLTVILCSLHSFAQKNAASFIKNRPKPAHAVNDFGKVLKKDERSHLEGHSKAFQEKTGNSIVLITLPSLPNNSESVNEVVELGKQYFDKWNMGDSGVLILTIHKPLMVTVRMGKRFETLLTKADLNRFINEDILPSFNQNHIFIGLKDGVYAMESTIEEAMAARERNAQEATAVNDPQTPQHAYTPYQPQQKELTLGETIGAFITLGIIIFYFVYRSRRRRVLAQAMDTGFDSDAEAWLTRAGTTIRRTVNDH